MEKFHRAHTTANILVIDSDPLLLTAIGAALDMQGHKVTLARTAQVAQQTLQSQVVDLIILGIEQLDEGSRFAAALREHEANREIPIIFLVPQMSSHWAATLQAQGGIFCVLRALDPHELLDLVDKALWMPHVAGKRSGPPAPHTQTSKDWIKLD